MRTVKPMRLGVLHRVLELGRRPHLIVSMFAATRLSGAKEALTEVDLWKLVEKSLGTGSILDEGYSKPAGEVVVHATFHAPHGKAVPISFAGLEVTRDSKKIIDKRLAIFGPREWRSGVPSEPEQIATLKLDWTHAFGGEDFPANPVGFGMKPKDSDAPWALPQIEDPKHLVRAPSDRPQPAGFGPLDLGSVERRALAGDYGGDYLEKSFPGPAADMDARFFHTAREDQRIDGFFRGGEHLALVNMREGEPRLEGVLHPLRGRAFIQRGEGAPLVEVPLRIDTLIVFASDGALVAVHRGVVPVDEDDASDVTTLIIGAEDPSMPRSVEHYHSVVKRRTDRDNYGPLWALHDEDLMPQREAGWGSARFPDDDITAMTKTENLLEARMSASRERLFAEKRAMLAAGGFDPDVYSPIPAPPEPVPPSDDVAGLILYIEKTLARQEEEQAKSVARAEALRAEGRARAKAAGIDWDAALEQARLDGSGPPKRRTAEIRERTQAQAELARNAGAPDLTLERMLEDPTFLAAYETQDQQALESYRVSAPYHDAAPTLSREASTKVRERFAFAHAAGRRPEDIDATGADLSKLDLSGMDLSGALLECADLTDTVLDRASLQNAVLTRAKLERTRFVNANLEGANLGDATFADVDLSGARLKKAWFTKSRIEKASFVGADLTESMFLEASFGAVDFSGAVLSSLAFYKLDLTKTRFTRATLDKAQFVECDLSNVDFTGAKLDGSVWLKTRADGACLVGARMKQVAWPSEVVATRVDLRGAHIERSCFRGANLQHGDFTGATLSMCDFGNADLTDAKLVEANARGSMFVRANFTRVNARGASFMEAILTNTLLYGADFSKANLFRAMLSRARGDDATRFTGANVEAVLHEPHYESPAKRAERG